MSESSWSSDEEWTTIAAIRDTQDNGSNAVAGDTEDGSSVTNRQQIDSNDTQGTNAWQQTLTPKFYSLPFQILDSNHSPSCIFSGCKLHFFTFNSIEWFRRKFFLIVIYLHIFNRGWLWWMWWKHLQY
jgi:hypothetical protein